MSDNVCSQCGEVHDRRDQVQAIIDLAHYRLCNPQDLTPNTERDLKEILRIAKELFHEWGRT